MSGATSKKFRWWRRNIRRFKRRQRFDSPAHVPLYNIKWICRTLPVVFQGTYEYGCQLLNAALALRHSCKLSEEYNSELTQNLRHVWNRLQTVGQEQMTRLRVSAVFHRSVEEVSAAESTSLNNHFTLVWSSSSTASNWESWPCLSKVRPGSPTPEKDVPGLGNSSTPGKDCSSKSDEWCGWVGYFGRGWKNRSIQNNSK